MAKKSAEVAAATPKKTQMVSAAMDALGDHASPSTMQPWIHGEYGVEIDKQMLSSYASQLRKKRRATGGGPGEAGAPPAAHSDAVSMRDIGVIKGLIDQYGAHNLTGIIKVLAR